MPKARPTVGPRVEVDGLKEYKQAISELNASNKTLSAELRKLQAEYKGNEDSTEFLTKKGKILEDQLLRQKEKVEQLRAAMQLSAKENGEASTTTQQYATSLANAEAEVFNLQHAIEDNTKALQGEGEQMLTLSDLAQTLGDKLGVKIPDGAKKALDGIGSFSAGSVAKFAAVTAAITAAIKVLKELHELTLQAAADVDDLVTESMVTGLSTKTLQSWQYAEDLIDVPVSTMTSAMTKLTKSMGEAQAGSENAIEMFTQLGVSITDSNGQLRDAESVFYEVVDALGEIDNQTERDVASMELLGKGAQDLNPLFAVGSKALKDFASEAEATGYVLDESQIQKLAQVDDAYHRMQLTVEASKKQLAADFAPASEAAMELFTKAVQMAAEALEKSGIIENTASILGSLMDIGETILDLIGSFPGLEGGLKKISNAMYGLALLAAAVADAFKIIMGLQISNWGSGMLREGLGLDYNAGNPNNIQRTIMQHNGTYGEYQSWFTDGQFNGYNAGGTDNWRGGWSWVGENGPELALMPSGTQILTAQESRSMGGDTINITVDVSSLEDLDRLIRWAKGQKIKGRMK